MSIKIPTKTKKIEISTAKDEFIFTIYELPIYLIDKLANSKDEEIELLEYIKECSDLKEEDIKYLPYSAVQAIFNEVLKLTYGDDLDKQPKESKKKH